MALGVPASLLGWIVSGDIGGYTCYTDRHMRKVVFPAAPPKVPRSILQAHQRQFFAIASADWQQLSPETQQAYERASKKLSLPMAGRNLFFSLAFRQDDQLRRTLERQSRETLPMPPDPRRDSLNEAPP